jgi:hypothetical protein
MDLGFDRPLYLLACPAEKSGQIEFDFEYGTSFAAHIEAFQLTFSKVLVRYNPSGDALLNQRQSTRLRQLSDYLHNSNRSMFMFELLVPPETFQLDEMQGDRQRYDSQLRPQLGSKQFNNCRIKVSSRTSGKSKD